MKIGKWTSVREWIAIHILRFDKDLFELAPEHSTFKRADLGSTCAGCVRVFKMLDSLAALHETESDVKHFLTSMGIWWIHNTLKSASLETLVTSFATTLNAAGVPVETRKTEADEPKGGYVAH